MNSVIFVVIDNTVKYSLKNAICTVCNCTIRYKGRNRHLTTKKHKKNQEKKEIVEPEDAEPEIVEPEIVEPEIVEPEIVKPEDVEEINLEYEPEISNYAKREMLKIKDWYERVSVVKIKKTNKGFYYDGLSSEGTPASNVVNGKVTYYEDCEYLKPKTHEYIYIAHKRVKGVNREKFGMPIKYALRSFDQGYWKQVYDRSVATFWYITHQDELDFLNESIKYLHNLYLERRAALLKKLQDNNVEYLEGKKQDLYLYKMKYDGGIDRTSIQRDFW